MLAAIGQGGGDVPFARAHAGGLGVQIEVPLAAGQPELIPGRRGVRRRGVDGWIGTRFEGPQRIGEAAAGRVRATDGRQKASKAQRRRVTVVFTDLSYERE